MNNCIYRFINNENKIIYIGKAKDLKLRLAGHTHLPEECYREKEFIEYCIFETEDDMDFAERYFISKVKPKYNEIHKNKNITVTINKFENIHWLRWGNNNTCSKNIDLFKINKDIENVKNTIAKLELKKDLLREIQVELITSTPNPPLCADSMEEYLKIEDRMKKISNEISCVNKKFEELKEQRLREILGDNSYEKLDKDRLFLFLKFETTTDTETVNVIWNNKKKNYINKCTSQIESDSFFKYTDMLVDIDSDFNYKENSYCNDCKWLKLLYGDINIHNKNKISFFVNKMINEVEEYLVNIYGNFVIDTIIEEDSNFYSAMTTGSIKIPQSHLIKRIA